MFKQKDNTLLILLPFLGSISWTSLWKRWQIFSYTSQKTSLAGVLSTAICDIRREKNHLLSVAKIWFIYGQHQSALIVLYDYTLMCIYHEGDGLACFANLPTGLYSEGQKQTMAFTASKLYQHQKFIEKQHRVIPAEFFQMLYLRHCCYNSSCKDQCCSHYSSNVMKSFISAGLSRHFLLPLPVLWSALKYTQRFSVFYSNFIPLF